VQGGDLLGLLVLEEVQLALDVLKLVIACWSKQPADCCWLSLEFLEAGEQLQRSLVLFSLEQEVQCFHS
jgi:hypothetical protein